MRRTESDIRLDLYVLADFVFTCLQSAETDDMENVLHHLLDVRAQCNRTERDLNSFLYGLDADDGNWN